MTDYKILQNVSAYALAKEVTFFLDKGYRLAGPLIHVAETEDEKGYYSQSVVLYDRVSAGAAEGGGASHFGEWGL